MLTKTLLRPARVLSRLPHLVIPHPDALTLIKASVLALGGLAAVWALQQPPKDWSAFLIMLGAVIVTEMTAIARRTSTGVVSFTFLPLLTAVFIDGTGSAIQLGIFSALFGDGFLRGRGWRSAEKAGLLALMLLVGGWLSGHITPDERVLSAASSVIMGYWLLVFAIVVVLNLKNSNYTAIGTALAIGAFGWVLVLLSHSVWASRMAQWLPALGLAQAMGVLLFTAGFMLIDHLATSAAALLTRGPFDLRFWQYEITPAFYQYNALAIASLPLLWSYMNLGLAGLTLTASLVGMGAYARYLYAGKEELLVSGLCALASTLDAKDENTQGHSHRVAMYAVALAKAVGLDAQRQRKVQIAAQLHDIGKIGIPDSVLLKPGKFTPEEYDIMKRHVPIGVGILWNVPELREAALIVGQEHERWNGSGYPNGLSGENIRLESRIIGIADVYDALTSERPYRTALSSEMALTTLRQSAGTELDPRLVATFQNVVNANALNTELEFAYCLTH